MILGLLGLFAVNSKCDDKKESYIKAVAEWHIFLVIVIYTLSAMNSLNIVWLSATFAIANIVIWSCVFKAKLLAGLKKPEFNIKKNLLIVIPCIMVLIALWFAWDTVPYNWDSMTYHLPRLAHWTQNQSVAPYATHIDRQVGSTTLASYVSLIVYIFSGKRDILLNMVQCMAYITNAVFVYSIARKCKVNSNFSVAAAVLYLAMPIAFAEATTTQNDNFATMWLLFFVYLLIDFLDKNNELQYTKSNGDKIIFAAVCMGFGYLAKPSVCFAMAVLLCFLLVAVIRRKDNCKDIFKFLGVAIVSFVLTVLPQFLFNMSVYGKALPDNVGRKQLIGTLQPNYMFVNGIKNFTYNLGNSLWTGSKQFLSDMLYGLADVCNVALNDPTISENGSGFGFSSHQYGCDTALNPLVLVLALLGILWCIIRAKKQNSTQVQFSFFAMISYIVFCIFLRWEHFISRYLLTYFALMCPLIAIQLQDFCSVIKNKNLKRVVVMLFGVVCAVNYYYVIDNVHTIETKEYPDSYFYHVGGMRSDYIDICNTILEDQYKEIGIMVGTNSYEYPLWGILNSQSDDFVIRHVNVENELSQYEDKTFTPECIFAVDRMGEDSIIVNGYEYVKVMSGEQYGVHLYEKSN